MFFCLATAQFKPLLDALLEAFLHRSVFNLGVSLTRGNIPGEDRITWSTIPLKSDPSFGGKFVFTVLKTVVIYSYHSSF
jgi:hypothetical protein